MMGVSAGSEKRPMKNLPKGLYRPKGSKTVWMTYTYQGKSRRESTGTDDVKLAKKILDNVKYQIAHDKFLEYDYRQKTFKELIDKFHESQGINAREQSHIRFLTEFFGENATLKQIDERCGEFESWRRKIYKSANATIVKDLGFLRRVFNIAKKQWKWKVENPVSNIELPEVKNKRIRFLSDDELERMLDSLEESPDWLRTSTMLALFTGLRVENVLDLKWVEINLDKNIIMKDFEDMKNDEYLGIPINASARAVLEECAKVKCLSGDVFHDTGQHIYYGKQNRAFREARERAKVENFKFHDFRHCFCSYLRQRGVDLHTISKLVGHKDTRMTERYAHLSVESLRKPSAEMDDFFTIFSKKRQEKRELSA